MAKTAKAQIGNVVFAMPVDGDYPRQGIFTHDFENGIIEIATAKGEQYRCKGPDKVPVIEHEHLFDQATREAYEAIRSTLLIAEEPQEN